MSKVYLTDRMIRGLTTEGGRAEVWDTVIPGLGLRYSGRKKTWFFVFHSPELRNDRGHRRRRRMTLGDYPKVSLADARALVAEEREKLERGIDPAIVRGAAAPASVRFRDLGLEYLERESKPKKVRWDRDVTALRSLLPVFGDRVAAEITRHEIQEYLEGVAAKRGPWVPYDHLTALRRMLEWGVLKMGLPANPARGIPRERRPPRERVLTAEEVRRMWQVCEAETGATGSLLLRLRLVTAQRGTQLRQLNTHQLERDASGLWWNVPSKITKTRRPNRLFLGPLAEKVLADGQPCPEGWYLGRPTHKGERSQVGKSFRRRLLPAMGSHDWKGMDLRRTAATWMARGGVSRFIVKRVLGHADHDITAVYDLYSYDPEVKAAVLILEEAIRQAIGRPNETQNGPAGATNTPPGLESTEERCP